MILRSHEANTHFMVIAQICLYFCIALLIGWLWDRERKQQNKLVQNEKSTALGKAASALSLEVQDIVRQIEGIYQQKGATNSSSQDGEIISEIERLKNCLMA